MKISELLTESQLNELSSDTLAKYKKAAGADARAADKEGDFERGNKRFSGIVRATKKEFDHDDKKRSEQDVKESDYSPMTKDAMKSDKIRSLENLIAKYKEQGRQLKVQELELELKKLQGVAEGMGDTKTEVVDKYKGWRFEIETQEEDDRYVKFYGAVSPDDKYHSLPKRATKEQFRQFVDDKTVTEGVSSKYLSGTEKVDNISPVLGAKPKNRKS